MCDRLLDWVLWSLMLTDHYKNFMFNQKQMFKTSLIIKQNQKMSRNPY